ncbi:MAG: OmcB family cysteine-rich outer membrane protein [Verrucomicrobiae bacterium]|nr:OmcB family cysteine-rich outer membrane protein [Verrucomicrobiae bacterium]
MTKCVPAAATVGETVQNDLTLTALANCDNAVVTDTIPDGASYVRSEPSATQEGRKLVWRFDKLDKGQVVPIKVWYKAEREGNLVNCATMVAIPRGCATTVVGKAALAINKSGPATANIGQQVNYTVTVRNTGSAVARNVVVTDTVPDGLSSATGQRTLTFNVGDLAPGQSKDISVPLKADRRGRHCNVAAATASNAARVSSEACTTVMQPGLAIAKDGTKQQFLGRTATYNIVVSNTGDTDLKDVVVTDTAPAATRIVKAEGASVSGNTATWRLPTLAKGAKENLSLVLTSSTPGSHCNEVAVRSAEGLTANSRACTLWKGIPAILIEVVDDPDPIAIGETTTYTIRVTNQGTADDKNIKLVASFGKEIDPLSGSGATAVTVTGKTVDFGNVATLAPKQSVTWTVRAKGVVAGDHRLKVKMTSDMLQSPVTEEESTHVY